MCGETSTPECPREAKRREWLFYGAWLDEREEGTTAVVQVSVDADSSQSLDYISDRHVHVVIKHT